MFARKTLALTLFLSASVAAGDLYYQGNPIHPLGLYGTTQFGQAIEHGDFTGDGQQDIVLLDAGVPVLCMNPAVFRTYNSWGSNQVNDLAAIPGIAGGRARLFATDATGLKELVWDEVNVQWTATTVDTGMGWAGARKVIVGDFDGLHGLDLAGLSGTDDMDVVVKCSDGAGGFSSSTVFSMGGDNHDLVAIDWDGDGTDEIFGITDGGVEGWEPAGTLVASLAHAAGVDLIATLKTTDPADESQSLAEESLAMIRINAAGKQELAVWSSSGGVEAGKSLLFRHAISICAADLDDDNDSDVLVGLDSHNYMLFFRAFTASQKANPSDPRFTSNPQPWTFGNPSRDPADNGAGMVVADFDHDDEPEIIAPSQGDATAQTYPTAARGLIDYMDMDGPNETKWGVDFGLPVGAPREYGGGWHGEAAGGSTSSPTLYFDLPDEFLAASPQESLKLRITFWETASRGTLGTRLQPLFVTDIDMPGNAGDPHQFVETRPYEVDVDPGPLVDLVDYWDTEQPAGGFGTWVVQQVVLDSNGDVVDQGPASVCTWAYREVQTSSTILDIHNSLEAHYPGKDLLDSHFEFGDGTPAAGGFLDGAMAVGGWVPEFMEEEAPDPRNPRVVPEP